uniref:CSON009201 protein n=1 Tax=Culicoides sonorensis TaxID=179676 RepID=A0A336M2C0_CULSO
MKFLIVLSLFITIFGISSISSEETTEHPCEKPGVKYCQESDGVKCTQNCAINNFSHYYSCTGDNTRFINCHCDHSNKACVLQCQPGEVFTYNATAPEFSFCDRPVAVQNA